MKILDPGHVYEMEQLGCSAKQTLIFVKRSGGVIQYEHEWPGLQTQEVLRVLIDRTQYLDGVLECTETEDAVWHLRMALYLYEARAYRRKQAKVNREAPAHDDSNSPKAWRWLPFDDVPFNEHEIELRSIGLDGHVIWDDLQPDGEGSMSLKLSTSVAAGIVYQACTSAAISAGAISGATPHWDQTSGNTKNAMLRYVNEVVAGREPAFKLADFYNEPMRNPPVEAVCTAIATSLIKNLVGGVPDKVEPANEPDASFQEE